MGRDGDLKLAKKFAEAEAKMVREYIAEMRRQGRIKGKLFVTVKEGKRQITFPYREELKAVEPSVQSTFS